MSSLEPFSRNLIYNLYISNNFVFLAIKITIIFVFSSDPILNANSNERASVQQLLERLILEEEQFDVHDILPNTVADPASLVLESDYACPIGQVVQAQDCGNYF